MTPHTPAPGQQEMSMNRYSEMPEAKVLAEIETLQGIQKSCRSTYEPKWEQASAMLAPLFEEMARRQKASA